MIEVRGAFPTVAADDSCGAQTRLTWRSAVNQNVTVLVRGYNSAEQGDFQLAHGGSNDQVFRSGFQ